jgi:hypothetical protein
MGCLANGMWGRKSDTWTNLKPPSNSEVGEEGDSFDFGKLRASLTEPVNPAGTELFRRIYGFGPNVSQISDRKDGPARKISSGA